MKTIIALLVGAGLIGGMIAASATGFGLPVVYRDGRALSVREDSVGGRRGFVGGGIHRGK